MSKKSMHKDSTRYYRQIDVWQYVGAAMIIVGLVWFWLGRSMASYYIPCVITPLGLVLFLVFSSRHISDNDMLDEQKHRILDYDSQVTNRNDYTRYVLKQPADVETEAYHMGARAAYFKRGKNGTLISDRYVRTHFFFTHDNLVVCSREVSMTASREDAEAWSDTYAAIPYQGILSAVLEENQTDIILSNTKKTVTAKWLELVITGQEGELLRVPVKNDMDMSTLCEELKRKARQMKHPD